MTDRLPVLTIGSVSRITLLGRRRDKKGSCLVFFFFFPLRRVFCIRWQQWGCLGVLHTTRMQDRIPKNVAPVPRESALLRVVEIGQIQVNTTS